jgi:hypothetical protein
MRFTVAIYASEGTRLTSATVDDQPVTMTVRADHGHAVFVIDLAVDRLTSKTLALQLTEPRLAGQPVVPAQPLARPQQTNVQATACSAG